MEVEIQEQETEIKDEATAEDGQTGMACFFWKVFLETGLLNWSLV